MKPLFIVFLYFITVQAYANMAEPLWRGTLSASPFISKYADVLNETLNIKVDENFENAEFQVTYNIKVSKTGRQIPILFYASEYLGDFNVYVDGKRVETLGVPNDYDGGDIHELKDFDYIFGEENSVSIEVDENTSYGLNEHDMIYFLVDLEKGNHVIEVSYISTTWIDKSSWIQKYSFRYALSPVQYWKSFNNLKVKLDASQFKGSISHNLGEAFKLDENGIYHWHFKNIPTNVILINYNPELPATAKTLIAISPFFLGVFAGVILVILHIYVMRLYRRKKPDVRFSPVVWIGALLVPLIFLMSWVGSYNLIDYIIGIHASNYHGYNFLLIYFLYPIILVFYWLIIWAYDSYLKRNPNIG